MKRTITLSLILLAFVAASFTLTAQINADSPVPANFVVNSPASIQGSYSYAAQVNSGAGGEWGPRLSQTVTGDLVWAYDITGDSLNCDSIVTDLTGKMALIRRGACNFSLKVHNAELKGAIGVVICNHYSDAAQTENSLVGMQAADTFSVGIPAVFVSRLTCETITTPLDAGTPVNVSFKVEAFSNPLVAYSLNTPVSGIVPLGDISMTYLNTSENIEPSVTFTAEITDPNGAVTTLTKTLTNLEGFSVSDVVMDDAYLPTVVGEYKVHFSNSSNDETLDKNFFITDYTYAQDNDVIDETQDANGVFNGTFEPSEATFLADAFVYDFGNFYRTGAQTQVATHVTFVLGSYNELWTGDPEADVFKVRIYDADPDGNGIVPDATTYDALDEADGSNPPIGGADFILDGATPNFTRTILELDEPITLQPNKIYLVMVQYNGISAATGIPPKPAIGIGTNSPVAGGLSSARYGDRFYMNGWGVNSNKFVVRLHVDGFTDAKEKPLDQSKISIAPNPVSSVLNLDLSLEKAADKVDLRVMDFTGRLVKTEKLENVHQGTYSLNVQDLAVGTYFLSVSTPEGFRAKKFVVAR